MQLSIWFSTAQGEKVNFSILCTLSQLYSRNTHLLLTENSVIVEQAFSGCGCNAGLTSSFPFLYYIHELKYTQMAENVEGGRFVFPLYTMHELESKGLNVLIL
ncbi:hypothetical protein L6164_023221 [Bauhinia variegata]|uniref:Uncharacterized protein n=1 Tax=Bauhinia variegata TaxID=167791 RepID=A0ACB9ML56_BAUVA|nr:hypothetical protein L6164_023221 [Bauhinia variegata]